MADKIIIGGYPIVGKINIGDCLWFTGTKWTPIPYGEQGIVETLIQPPYAVIPILSNGYFVSTENLKQGDILCVVRTLTTDLNKKFEYVTNIPFSTLDNRLNADNITTSYNITIS